MYRITVPLLALVLVTASAEIAVAESTTTSVAVTDREAFLASSIAAMVLSGVVSFLLAGRVSVRIHVALAMLVVLIGGFALFVLFQPVLSPYRIATVLGALAMVGLFKFMSRFEARERPKGPPPNRAE